LNRKIAELKAEQAKMQEDRKRLKKELRNTARKRKRIKERARQLTEDDLVAVLMMRKEH
jgi:cell division protein FtsB